MKPGTSVRISSNLCFFDGCTGVVTETPEFWVELGFSNVAIDKGILREGCFLDDEELTVIGATERDGHGQADLFGGAP